MTAHLGSLDLPFRGGGPESFSANVTTGSTTTILSFTSILQPLLSSGTTYWIEAFPGATTTFVGWQFDSMNYYGVDLQHSAGGAWSPTPGFNTPSLDVVAVSPEPFTGLITGLSLLIFGFLLPGLRRTGAQVRATNCTPAHQIQKWPLTCTFEFHGNCGWCFSLSRSGPSSSRGIEELRVPGGTSKPALPR